MASNKEHEDHSIENMPGFRRLKLRSTSKNRIAFGILKSNQLNFTNACVMKGCPSKKPISNAEQGNKDCLSALSVPSFTLYQDSDQPPRYDSIKRRRSSILVVDDLPSYHPVPSVLNAILGDSDDEADDFAGIQCAEMVQTWSDRVPPLHNSSISEQLFAMTDYEDDIYRNMRASETNPALIPKWNYMTRQTDITYTMRAILIDWLVEVGVEYSLQTETVHLAVQYIDRFLSYMSVQRSKLQLVGTACLFIAAKYEEIYPPELAEFCYVTDDTYTKRQVLKMEQLVLKVLDFNLTIPTVYFFVHQFNQWSHQTDLTVQFLAQFLCELTLMDSESFLRYSPSLVAAASLCLARHTLGQPTWTPEMASRSGYSVIDIKNCLVIIHDMFENASKSPQQAIREKYRHLKYRCVSQIHPAAIALSVVGLGV